MSATAENPSNTLLTMLPVNSSTIYGASMPFSGPAQRVVDEFIRKHIRPVRYNNAHAAAPLKRRAQCTKHKINLGQECEMEYEHFSLDAVEDIQRSQEFTKLLLDIYENALSLEIATVLDANADVKNPEMLARIRELGVGLVDNATEMAADNSILKIGIYNLMQACSCIVETHKALLHSAAEQGHDRNIVSVYVSLAQRTCKYYAVSRIDIEA